MILPSLLFIFFNISYSHASENSVKGSSAGYLNRLQAKQGCYLEGKIPRNNSRYYTFLSALNLMSERKAKVIVETGTSRNGASNCLGDGCSTLIFSQWVQKNGGEYYSVDISMDALINASNGIGSLKEYVHFVQSDSVAFLQNFNQTIDFLYLDSYDFEINNPTPSQEHHLKEIIAAYPFLTEDSVVMIDDCDLPHGGKGKLVIEYLLNKGWKIAMKGYQVIMVQK